MDTQLGAVDTATKHIGKSASDQPSSSMLVASPARGATNADASLNSKQPVPKKGEEAAIFIKKSKDDSVLNSSSENNDSSVATVEDVAGKATGESYSEEQLQEAKERAKELESKLSRTKVQFKVEVNSEDDSLKFQVVDAETGQVLRVFPPDEMPTMLTNASSGLGSLVDEAA